MSFRTGLLWKLNSSNLRPSYLFGTIHLQSPIVSNNQTLFSDLIDSCACFAAEIDLDKMESSNLQSYFQLENSRNWSNHLKPNQWNKLCRVSLDRFGIDLEQFTGLYPMIALNQLSLQLIGRSQEISLDYQLWQLAKMKQKKTLGLEDFDDHFSMIKSIELKDQIKMFRDFFKQLDRSKKRYEKMISDYNLQDIQSIYKRSRKMLGKYRQLMLNQRNQAMVSSIKNISTESNAFFCCGAGHLYGSEGLLRLLKKAGFHLQPVRL